MKLQDLKEKSKGKKFKSGWEWFHSHNEEEKEIILGLFESTSRRKLLTLLQSLDENPFPFTYHTVREMDRDRKAGLIPEPSKKSSTQN